MVRAAFYDKNGLKKGEWSSEEDEKLEAYIQRYGHSNWRQLPKFAGLARCGKSCRLRWLNYLRPNLRYGDYTQAEEEIIIKLHQQLGNKWSTIAAHLPGRTDSEIKNHWHTTLKKRFQQNKLVTNEEVKASKPRDNELNTGSVQSMLDNVSDSDGLLLSPLACSSELLSSSSSDHDIINTTVAACNEKMVIEEDFTFLDAFIEPINESFWTEPYNPSDISYSTPSDHCNGAFQSLDSIQILDAVGASSHHQSFMEESLVPEEVDFSSSFRNAQTGAIIMDDFWTQPYVPDMSPTFHHNYIQNNFL